MIFLVVLLSMTIKHFNKHALTASVLAITIAGAILWSNSQQTIDADTRLLSNPNPASHSIDNIEAAQANQKKALSSKILPHHEETEDYPMETPQRLPNYFSSTLEGTDIDGGVRVGSDGHIELSIEVKDFIDYFLSAVGDVTPEQAIDAMFNVLDQSLPPENVAEVRQLLDDYLAYKEDAANLMAQPMLPREQQTKAYQLQVMERSLEDLRALRRAHMSQEALEAFFGLEEAYENYTIASIRVQFDDNLSEQEKVKLIQYHRSQLPETIRVTEEQMVQDNERNADVHAAIMGDDVEALESELDAYGYTEEQKAEIIAFKLAQQDFDKRYQKYSEERSSMLSGVTDEATQKQITAQLLGKYFDSEEEQTQAKVRDLNS